MYTVSTTGLNEAWLPFIGEERKVPRDRKYNMNVPSVEQLANSNYFLLSKISPKFTTTTRIPC